MDGSVGKTISILKLLSILMTLSYGMVDKLIAPEARIEIPFLRENTPMVVVPVFTVIKGFTVDVEEDCSVKELLHNMAPFDVTVSSVAPVLEIELFGNHRLVPLM